MRLLVPAGMMVLLAACQAPIELDRCQSHPEQCFTVEVTGDTGLLEGLRVHYLYGAAPRAAWYERFPSKRSPPITVVLPIPDGAGRDPAAQVACTAWGFRQRVAVEMGQTSAPVAAGPPSLMIALTPVTDACADHLLDGDETDVDCGGPCDHCARGRRCRADSDCDHESMCAARVCTAAPCYDGKLDGQETGVDCGGPECSACPAGNACMMNSDCASAACDNAVCQ